MHFPGCRWRLNDPLHRFRIPPAQPKLPAFPTLQWRKKAPRPKMPRMHFGGLACHCTNGTPQGWCCREKQPPIQISSPHVRGVGAKQLTPLQQAGATPMLPCTTLQHVSNVLQGKLNHFFWGSGRLHVLQGSHPFVNGTQKRPQVLKGCKGKTHATKHRLHVCQFYNFLLERILAPTM